MKIDQLADVNFRDLYKFSQVYDLPDFVKQADVQSLLGEGAAAECQSELFGDPAQRQFPAHTKEACWLSYLYFTEKKAEIPSARAELINSRLQSFGAYHGITEEMQGIEKTKAKLAAEAGKIDDSDYALVHTDEAGKVTRHYPLRNAEETIKAASWLMKYRDQLAFRDRQTIAERILDKVAAYGALLDDEMLYSLEKQAGYGTFNPDEAAAMLRNRVKAAGRRALPALREQLNKTADLLEKNAEWALDPGVGATLAETVDLFDRTTGLHTAYCDSIPRPEDVFFKGIKKAAADFIRDAVPLVNGAVYEQSQLGSLSLVQIRDAFGKEAAETVSSGLQVDEAKLAKLASALSYDDANVLGDLLESQEVYPIYKRSARREQLSTEDWLALAKS